MDTQTGVVIKEFNIEGCDKIMFHGDQRTITLIQDQYIHTYDALDGSQLWEGRADSSPHTELGAHWTNGDTLWFATTFESDGESVVNVHRLQPAGPLLVVYSFPSLPQSKYFSFSPVSFHASFATEDGFTIFDVQDSKLLLQTRADHSYNPSSGQFSPDGCFFSCEPLHHEILIWQNASTGYVPWRSLRLRFSHAEYLWSPTSMSIMCWGEFGVWLLDPGNHPSPSLPNEVQPSKQYCNHLVAYSADRAYIATVQEDCGVVTVLNCLSGTSWQFTDTGMETQDIRIAENTIFVVDKHKLLGWAIETDMAIHGAPNARKVTVDEILTTIGGEKVLTLSHDCSQIVLAKGWEVLIYNVKTQQVIHGHRKRDSGDVRLSPDGLHMWFCTLDYHNYCFVELEGVGSRDHNQVIQGCKKDGQILFNRTSPCGYHVELDAKWVTDPSNRKLLWLSPSWRTSHWGGIRWDDNFLALLDHHHPGPIIIKFKH